MVFSSIPVYLDSHNWQQQHQPQNYQGGSNTGTGAAHNFHPPPTPPPPPPPFHLQPHGLGGGGGAGSIRPGSMADRARMANLPMPEIALKCPRCESTNTKFCYFNNYSLTQPRHFCKMCRRYWTRGGSLRNIPVGGGCRRNKRSSKGTSSGGGGGGNSKSSPVSSSSGGGGGATSTNHVMVPSPSVSSGGTMDVIGLGSQFPSMRFMGSNLHNLSNHDQYGNITGDLGLSYAGIDIPAPLGVSASDINFYIGNSSSGGGGGSVFLSGMEQQWKLQQTQQFPFFATDELTNNPSVVTHGSVVRPKTVASSGLLTLNHDQGSSVKMELNNQDMNFSSRSLGMNIQGNEQYNWTSTSMTTPAWTDLPGFSSSSTSHPL